jgi:hypothetical protein
VHLNKIKQKKAAIELSIGTVVVIVLAMAMLILGLVLVRSIFTLGTESVDTLSEKVKGEITSIFTEEGSKIAIRLGSNRLAKIESGTNDFGIAIGAKTSTGDPANQKNLRYALELLTNNDCSGFSTSEGDNYLLDHDFKNGARIGNNFATDKKRFEDEAAENGYVRLIFDIPKGTAECTQKIKIHTYDDDTCPQGGTCNEIESLTFTVQVVSGGIFS